MHIIRERGQLWVRVTTVAEAVSFGFDIAEEWEVIVSHPARNADIPGYEDHYDRETTDIFAAFDRRLLAAGYLYADWCAEEPEETGYEGDYHIYQRPR